MTSLIDKDLIDEVLITLVVLKLLRMGKRKDNSITFTTPVFYISF